MPGVTIHKRMRCWEESSASSPKTGDLHLCHRHCLTHRRILSDHQKHHPTLTDFDGKNKEISKGVFNDNFEYPSPPEISELTGAFQFRCAVG